MYKKMLLVCLIPLSIQASEPTDFVFHSPKTSGKTALFTTGAGMGGACAVHYALASLCNFFEITRIPVKANLFALPTNWLLLGVPLDFSLNSQKVIAAIAVSAGLYAAYKMFYYLPEGKFSTGRNQLFNVLEDETLNALLEVKDNLLEHTDHTYIEYTYPRLSAHNVFMAHRIALRQAAQELQDVINSSTDDAEMKAMSKAYKRAIERYITEIDDCIKTIKEDPAWLEELKAFEMQQAREAQQQLVQATYLSALMR